MLSYDFDSGNYMYMCGKTTNLHDTIQADSFATRMEGLEDRDTLWNALI